MTRITQLIAGLCLLCAVLTSADTVEEKALYRWDFSRNLQRWSEKVRRNDVKDSIKIDVDAEDRLLVECSAPEKIPGLTGDSFSLQLPPFFRLQVMIDRASVLNQPFTVMLRGNTVDKKQIYHWRLRLDKTSVSSGAMHEIDCQAPPGIEELRLYLNLGTGRLILCDVRIVPAADTRSSAYVHAEEILRNPLFKTTWNGRGNMRTGWQIVGEGVFRHHSLESGEGGWLECSGVQVRQGNLAVQFPRQYFIAFDARHSEPMRLHVRGVSEFMTVLAPDNKNAWQRHGVIFPVLQANERNVYLNISGTEFALRNVSMQQYNVDRQWVKQRLETIREELQLLLQSRPGSFQEQTGRYRQLVQDFSRGELLEDEYLQQLQQLLQDSQLKVLVE